MFTNMMNRANLLNLTKGSFFAAMMMIGGVASAADENKDQLSHDEMVAKGKELTTACGACHGPEGVSAIPQNPNLAGQVRGYIESQLKMFKSGERENAIMAGQVTALTEEDMHYIDAYYSSLEAPAAVNVIDENNEDLIVQAQLGEKIYRGGKRDFEIAACMSCHGPTGQGIPVNFPAIAKQPVEYLEAQLLAYKSGTRQNAMMNPIAFKLSESEIKALAVYINALTETPSESAE